MRAVVLAGGMGTRMRPLTLTTPKAMLPVLNRPFLEHLFQRLLAAGINQVTLATCYLPTPIESYFGDGRRFRLRISYEAEHEPLGTAGAVKNAAPEIGDTFIVINGDVFTDLDLRAMLSYHREKQAAATMALVQVDDPSAFGVVVTDLSGRITRFVEKPTAESAPSRSINAGIYIMEPHLLQEIPPHGTPSMLEKELFPLMAKRHDAFYGYPFDGFWLDAGTPQNYLKLHHHLLLSGRGGKISPSAMIQRGAVVSGPVEMGNGTVVETNATIMGPAALGRGCRIESGAVVGTSVLWDGVHVKQGSSVLDSVVATGCVIWQGCRVEGQVLGEGEEVKPSSSARRKTQRRR